MAFALDQKFKKKKKTLKQKAKCSDKNVKYSLIAIFVALLALFIYMIFMNLSLQSEIKSIKQNQNYMKMQVNFFLKELNKQTSVNINVDNELSKVREKVQLGIKNIKKDIVYIKNKVNVHDR